MLVTNKEMGYIDEEEKRKFFDFIQKGRLEKNNDCTYGCPRWETSCNCFCVCHIQILYEDLDF